MSYNRKGMSGGRLNGKGTFNAAILPGENHAYPDATWPEREKIILRHTHFALGLMWFLQNDESVSPAKREGYRRIGLPLDEYIDNNNLPYELYVREARRIIGRHVFTQHDNMLAKGLGRTPVHGDSIAFTDWSMDSHDCTMDRRPGYAYDGKLILTEESRPAHIPYRALLPQGVDNLLVPVCLSSTHVAWGAVRLEPVWMQVGEAAGLAAVLARKHKTTPGNLDADLLVRTLVANQHHVSFFNSLLTAANEKGGSLTAAAQYFATKGFFADYNVNDDQPLRLATARAWAAALCDVPKASWDGTGFAHKIAGTEAAAGSAVTFQEWTSLLGSKEAADGGDLLVTRGMALQMLYGRLMSLDGRGRL